MTYHVGWGDHATHFAVSVKTAAEALAAADRLQRHCQIKVTVFDDRRGDIELSALRRLAAVEEPARLRPIEACADRLAGRLPAREMARG